jgi:hypothetical protein
MRIVERFAPRDRCQNLKLSHGICFGVETGEGFVEAG